ncbi:hypothetical protein ECA1080 [Pectobacterium atrosepticum SCRI1043]|uniref:Uncharacterized protein n=1 Tax=Pectobacterium atrosepticum (strain SCRI 1043 / ATCC BAA-672) TaxID=218491 RepID=Q6D894_PECAS|nr:hypothetical protein ECA1080 [Pectobacterium atrosepticum SCRI1043]
MDILNNYDFSVSITVWLSEPRQHEDNIFICFKNSQLLSITFFGAISYRDYIVMRTIIILT